MKKLLILAAILVLVTGVACTQKSETNVTTDSDGTVSSTHIESTTGPAIDTAATAAAMDSSREAGRDAAAVAREAGRDTAAAARDAAHATGTALEKAGEKIQEKTDTTKTDTTSTKP
jgi:hypothetical protein